MSRLIAHLSKLKPGYWLIVLTSWWVFPFFVMRLFRYPLYDYLSSYYLYFMVFGTTIVFGFSINIFENRYGIWTRFGYWKKYLYISTLYTITITAILVIALAMGSKGLLDYFGGDAEVSFAILFIPSIVLHIVLGALVGLVLTGLRKMRSI